MAKFYESEEGRLIDEGQALEREIEEEETREERERERETARWAAEDAENDHDGLGYVDEEGESTVGSLGVKLGTPAASRGRLGRARSSVSTHHRAGSNVSTSPTKDTSDLFEAQQSNYANRLRTQSEQMGSSQPTDGEDEDSSPENSPNMAPTHLAAPPALDNPLSPAVIPVPNPGGGPPVKRSISALGAGRRASSANTTQSPMTSKRRRRPSIGSSGTGGITGAGDLGLVLVDANSMAGGNMSTSIISEGPGHGHGLVHVWTSNGQRASMLKIIYKRRIAQLWLDWNALRSFRELNQEGVKKALKKFDKITSSKTKDAYLTNTLPTIYPWLPDVQALLEQQDAILVLTYARVVVGGDKDLAGRQLGSQLREKVVIERDTVWRQMVQQQRNSDLPGGLIRAVPDPRQADFFHEEKAAYYPFLKTPLGVVYFPRWLSTGGLTLILALGLLLLMVSGAIPTFDRVEERNCCAMLVFCTILWATEVSTRSDVRHQVHRLTVLFVCSTP